MGKPKPWHEDDEFWSSIHDWIFSEPMWESAVDEINNMITLLDLKPPAKILDLCCGAGRHALEFSRRGFKVTGVDRTVSYLDEALEKASHENLKVNFLQGEMRQYCESDTYDLIINMNSAFGYFEDFDEEKLVLKNVFDSLRPGGKFLVDLLGREVLLRIYQPRDWNIRGGAMILEERIPNDDWTFIENRWILIQGLARKEFRFKIRNYAGSELKSMLFETGFKKVNLYGWVDGSPYDHRARRLIAVAEK